MPIIETPSGQEVNLLEPWKHQPDFRDIAFSLAKICRFSGRPTGFYSIAQHSVTVAELLPPELAAYGLLDEAHKAFVGDITNPVKAAWLDFDPRALDAHKYLRKIWRDRIHEAARLPWPLNQAQQQQIKDAAFKALAKEERDLFTRHRTGSGLRRARGKPLKPMAEDRAAGLFVDKFNLLIGTAGEDFLHPENSPLLFG